jgi:hypothetical protein
MGVTPLNDLLRVLPDPVDSGIRSADLVARGWPAYKLWELEDIGWAYNRGGWWTKTTAGVLHLREADAAEERP